MNIGQAIDAIGTVVFGIAAIVTAWIGIHRGDPPKRIRERTCLVAAFALIAARGLLPDSWIGRGLYFAAMFVLAVTALWKGGRRVKDE